MWIEGCVKALPFFLSSMAFHRNFTQDCGIASHIRLARRNRSHSLRGNDLPETIFRCSLPLADGCGRTPLQSYTHHGIGARGSLSEGTAITNGFR